MSDLGEAWVEVVAATPDGWLFHGVALDDNSMDGGGWGPGWSATISNPNHCQWDDCDHDEAFRLGKGATPLAALIALRDDVAWTADNRAADEQNANEAAAQANYEREHEDAV